MMKLHVMFRFRSVLSVAVLLVTSSVAMAVLYGGDSNDNVMMATQIVGDIESDSSAVCTQGAITIEDFEGHSVQHQVIPEPGSYGVWYDVSSIGGADAEDTTLDGSPAMKIRDGGWTNGVYAIFENVVPPGGGYFYVSALMHIVEGGATDGIDAYQIGVQLDGTHRGSGPLSPCSYSADYLGLTVDDDTALPTQTLCTNVFSAEGGEDILIAFSTDVTSGDWNLNSGAWGDPDTYVVVDEIKLVYFSMYHMPAQDTDGDNDVDLADFGIFSQCFNGPNRAYAVSSPPELVAKCECLDQDGDSDVDLADFGVFSACFNGPNRAPAIGCP